MEDHVRAHIPKEPFASRDGWLTLFLPLFCGACEVPQYCDRPLSCDADAAAPSDGERTDGAVATREQSVTDLEGDSAQTGEVSGDSDSQSVLVPDEPPKLDASTVVRSGDAGAIVFADAGTLTDTGNRDGGHPLDGCAADNGGCDAQRACTIVDGGIECGPCPDGHLPEGATDCIPALRLLEVFPGVVTPSFDPTQATYAVRIPTFHNLVMLSVAVADDAFVSVEGTDLGSGGTWTSPILELGNVGVQIDVGRDGTVLQSYILTVHRAVGIESFQNPTPAQREYFGEVVALSDDGNTLAVGVHGDDSGSSGLGGDEVNADAPGSGAVYVYTRSGDAWSEPIYIKASNVDEGDGFGGSVALSGDGNTLAVGAVGEASSASGLAGKQTNNDLAGSGAVYLFDRSGESWKQSAYIKASTPGASALFGKSVALSADGRTLAVGASGEASSSNGVGGTETNDDLPQAGAAYVFRKSESWAQQAYIKATNPGEGDKFGEKLALSRDGATLAISALSESTSKAGVNVEYDDDALHAGAVYVYALNDNVWQYQAFVKATNPEAGDRFGASIAISEDGNTLVAGAPVEGSSARNVGGDSTNNDAETSGAAYVYVRDGTTWAAQAYVKPFNTAENQAFGNSAIALSASGDVLVVGAVEEDSSASGVGGDMDNRDTRLSGAVYTYLRRDSTWIPGTYVKSLYPQVMGHFGFGVATSADATTLAVGARDERGPEEANWVTSTGAVYVY